MTESWPKLNFEAEIAARHVSEVALGTKTVILGINVFPRSLEDLRSVISRLALVRVLQFITALVMLITGSVVLKSVVDPDALELEEIDNVVIENFIKSVTVSVSRALLFLVFISAIVLVYAIVNGAAMFYLKDPNYRITPINVNIVKLGFASDSFILYMTLGAFGNGVGAGIVKRDIMDVAVGPDNNGDIIAANVLVVLSFLLFSSFIYGIILSLVIYTNQHLIARASRLQAGRSTEIA
mmetsp:Transcript_10915/g.19286  ORF Transcript_10915/g.19286 Transcript_10915/m.19286 type:complete len:239 (+) Transcript_10915:314-1030(+)